MYLNVFSLIANEFSLGTIPILVCILGVSAIMSGLSGFGFSAIGALCLWLLPPKLGVPLLMTLSSANQLMSLGQLKADLRPWKEWWQDGPTPYLLGGAWLSLQIAVLAFGLGMLIGLVCATILRYGPASLQRVVKAYVTFATNTPQLVQIFFLFFALPEILQQRCTDLLA